MNTYVHTYIHAYILEHICAQTGQQTFRAACLYIHTYIHTFIHSYIHTSITHIHSCIHTYRHTYLHTYILSGGDIPDSDCLHIKCLKEYLHWPHSSVYYEMMEACEDFAVGEHAHFIAFPSPARCMQIWKCTHSLQQVYSIITNHKHVRAYACKCACMDTHQVTCT